jgi:hypothetical protein
VEKTIQRGGLGYALLNNVTQKIKSRRMRAARHVARMEDRRIACRVIEGELVERDLGVDGTIILKPIFKKWGGEVRTGLIRMETGGRFL